MSDQLPQPSNGKPRLSVSFVWFISTIVLCAVFILASVPRLGAQSNADDSRRYTAIIQNVFDFIQRHYVDTVDPKTIYEGAMSGMFKALGDPYSTFLTESDMSDLNDTTQGNFGGVGLYITKQVEEQTKGKPTYVEVAAPIEDTPGWRAGISPGDLITKIDNESTEKLTMDEVLARLRGVPGTQVTIQIKRGEKMDFPVTLTRAVIEVPTVKHAMVGDDIGYVRIITFTPMTTERVAEAIKDCASKNYRGLIIDLRNNYGGLLQAAIGVSDLFLDGGVVVSTKSRLPEENQVFTAKKDTLVPATIPVVVLINRGSASASEIVAGALKDRGRAYLVGEKSYGKGSVQQVYPIDSSGFKITIARYYTPSDVNIDKIGIPPDLEVAFPVLTDKDAESLNRLVKANRIPDFVKAEPKASADRVSAFVKTLSSEYGLDTALLSRLVRDEQNRATIAPVYDMEYDIQLKAAVDLLQSGKYPSLIKTTKTLKMLQDEASAKKDAEKTSAPTP